MAWPRPPGCKTEGEGQDPCNKRRRHTNPPPHHASHRGAVKSTAQDFKRGQSMRPAPVMRAPPSRRSPLHREIVSQCVKHQLDSAILTGLPSQPPSHPAQPRTRPSRGRSVNRSSLTSKSVPKDDYWYVVTPLSRAAPPTRRTTPRHPAPEGISPGFQTRS